MSLVNARITDEQRRRGRASSAFRRRPRRRASRPAGAARAPRPPTTVAARAHAVASAVDGCRRRPRPPAPSAATSSGIGDVRRQVVGGAQERRLVGVLDGDLGDDPSAEDHDRPVAGELDLLELRGVEQDRRARRRELAQELVDLALGADVDAARRVEAEHRPDAAGDPARDRHLLLVAARQAADLAPAARVSIWSCSIGAVDPSLLGACVDRAPRPEAGGERQGDVLADRALHEERLGAIGRDVDETGADRVGRMAERRPVAPSTSSSPSAGRSEPARMSNSSSWPWPSSATTPEDLARVQVERDVDELRRRARRLVARMRGVPRSAAAAGEPLSGGRAVTSRLDVAQHQRDDPLLGARVRRRRRRPSRLRAGRSRGRTRRAISIIRCEMKMMQRSVPRWSPDDLEDAFGQVGRQRGGHLVEHQHGRLDRRARARGR